MSDRVKYLLTAPDGVEESNIEGTMYWPDEDGRVETTNDRHRDVLLRHGYTLSGQVSIAAPAASRGVIEVDELGRAQLAAALAERGLQYPETASRAELAEIAEGWNHARRRGRAAQAQVAEARADALAKAEESESPASTPTPAPAATRGEIDFGAATYDELKGWLAAHGIAYAANTPKVKLREMAEAAFAELKKPRAEAA